MSASTIARWNAITMERDPNEQTSMKRPRDQDGGDDDDDDISLVSRSPSPQPDGMDVDQYDPYVRIPTPEPITVHTKIKPSNKGFSMLAKLGWTEGQPLGLSGDGRIEPIPFFVKRDMTGLGKMNQDVKMIETTVSQRRNLDSERQRMETEAQRRLREDTVARKTALQTEISSTLKAFYCALCEKQFQNVAQYDEHTNGYAHHHKARFKEMQASQRAAIPKEEVDKRKEKERKREEKELRKIAAAAGIKMPKPITATASGVDVDTGSAPDINGGLALAAAPSEPVGAFKKSGWATVGATTSTPPPPPHLPPPPPPEFPPSPPPPPPSLVRSPAAPSFRTAGWASLDAAGLSAHPSSTGTLSNSQPLVPPPPLPFSTSHTPASQSNWSTTSTPPPPPNSGPPVPPTIDPPPPIAAPVRTGWQQFKTGGSKRR